MASKTKKKTPSIMTIDDSTSPVELIRLITTPENNNRPIFEVVPQAVEFLKSITTPIIITGVAGLQRVGKSTFSNRVVLDLDNGQGFEVSDKSQSCTKGIWLSRLVKKHVLPSGEEVSILTLDSEGMSSVNSLSVAYDLCIFVITWLVCDVFCYNSLKSIDEQSIDKLSLVLELTKKIKANKSDNDNNIALQSEKDKEDNPEAISSDLSALAVYSPVCMWVIRDDTLTLEDKHGHAITHKQYLEECWAPQLNVAPAKNKLRAALRMLCPRRDCIGLPPPCLSKEDLSKINTTPLSGLSVDFQKAVFNARVQLKKYYTSPKKFNNIIVTGESFIPILKGLVDGINQDTSICTMDDITTLFQKEQVRIQYEQIFKEYKIQYQQQKTLLMATTKSNKKTAAFKHLMDPETLQNALDTLSDDMLTKYQKSTCQDNNLYNQLEKQMYEMNNQLMEFNLSNIRIYMTDELNQFELWCKDQSITKDGASLGDIELKYHKLLEHLTLLLGNSDAIVSLWCQDLGVNNKIWKWCIQVFQLRTESMKSSLDQLTKDHEAYILLQKLHQEQTETLNMVQHQFEIQKNELKQVNESIHIQELDLSTVKETLQATQSELNHIRMKQQDDILSLMTEHNTKNVQRSQLVQTLEAKVNDLTRLLEDAVCNLERLEFERQEYQHQIHSIELWKNQNEELLNVNESLKQEIETMRHNHKIKEDELWSRFDASEAENITLIENQRKEFLLENESLRSHLESIDQESKKVLQIQQQQAQEYQTNEQNLSLQLKQLEQNHNQVENKYTQLRLDTTKLQSNYEEKQNEHIRTITQLSNQWKDQMVMWQTKQSELEKKYHQELLTLQARCAKSETEAQVNLARYQEIVEDARIVKKMRIDSQSLTTELVKSQTELSILKHEKQERDKTLQQNTSELNRLSVLITKQEGDHKFELHKAKMMTQTNHIATNKLYTS